MNEPIQEKAPKPPGLLPKNVQSWLSLGLAVLMVVIMWLTGRQEAADRRPKPNAPVAQAPAPLRGERNQDRRVAEPHCRNCSARNSSRKTPSRSRPACSARCPQAHNRISSRVTSAIAATGARRRPHPGRAEEARLPFAVCFERRSQLSEELRCRSQRRSGTEPRTPIQRTPLLCLPVPMRPNSLNS